jgi:hypothetical protein
MQLWSERREVIPRKPTALFVETTLTKEELRAPRDGLKPNVRH